MQKLLIVGAGITTAFGDAGTGGEMEAVLIAFGTAQLSADIILFSALADGQYNRMYPSG